LTPTQRTAIGNGNAELPGVNGHSHQARRYREVKFDIINDHGGRDHVSTAVLLLAERAAGLNLLCEQFEARVANEERPPADEYNVYFAAVARQARVLSTLGIKRQPRPVNVVTPAEYLKQVAAADSARRSVIDLDEDDD
jgi:hypothetical protein